MIEKAYIDHVTESPYGKLHDLSGFAGLAAFWKAYRDFTDTAFDSIVFPKLSIDTDNGDWQDYRQKVLSFVDLTSVIRESSVSADNLACFAGSYTYSDGEREDVCVITLENGELYLDELEDVWPHTRLKLNEQGDFEVESLPFSITFATDEMGVVTGMAIQGPITVFRNVNRMFIRNRE